MGRQLGEAESRSDRLAEIAHGTSSGKSTTTDGSGAYVITGIVTGPITAQATASQALEQIVGRQATVNAVEAQIKRVFDIAEHTAKDVRDIESARRDVESARVLLDDLQERLKSTTEAMNDFAERKRQVDQLEQRLVRAEALTRDVRSTIEMISAQRSVIDQVLERSGSLSARRGRLRD
jgi:DNA repair exonuclease SbcCD ATPase subunit